MRAPRRRRRRLPAWAALLAPAVLACGDGTGPDRIVAGVDLDELFAQPTAAEISAVSDEWSARDVSAQSLSLIRTDTVPVGTAGQMAVRIVSHTVGGVLHYGAIAGPTGAPPASRPLVVLGHGGDGGVDVGDFLVLVGFALGDAAAEFVFLLPSFRSEPLVFQGTTYESGGAASPWDWDVDDALALLSVAAVVAPEADTGRVGVVGFSRGAGVGLLMAARDPRIDGVVEFFGPTDFFDAFVQRVVEDALLGSLRDLPGLADLDAQFIQPLRRGELTIDDVRPELVRRSPVYFAQSLPQIQVHHGTADSTVWVSQAQRLIEAMEAVGRQAPAFESFLYPGGAHNPLTLPGSLDRTVAFLRRVLSVPSAAP